MKRFCFPCLIIFCCVLLPAPAVAQEAPEIRLAVEFVDHAACAHIARHQGWYREAGLNIRAFDSYATGMALSAALAKGGIDAAYICLFPAINAYANAKVPIKVVAGTHLHGYGLIADSKKIKVVADLARPGIRLGCTREGSPPAALLHKLVDKYNLGTSLITRARRMPPPKLLLSLKSGQLDAAFFPEQFPTMGEMDGFSPLLSAADLWPGMQGSVLVVRDALIKSSPDTVKKLVSLTRRGIEFIGEHPEQAARIVAGALDVAGKGICPLRLVPSLGKLSVSPAAIEKSLGTRMVNTARIDPETVQDMIDYAASIGYIRRAFPAEEILDLRYLHE